MDDSIESLLSTHLYSDLRRIVYQYMKDIIVDYGDYTIIIDGKKYSGIQINFNFDRQLELLQSTNDCITVVGCKIPDEIDLSNNIRSIELVESTIRPIAVAYSRSLESSYLAYSVKYWGHQMIDYKEFTFQTDDLSCKVLRFNTDKSMFEVVIYKSHCGHRCYHKVLLQSNVNIKCDSGFNVRSNDKWNFIYDLTI